MNFLANFYLFSCYCGNTKEGKEYFVIRLIDCNGDKHNVFTTKELFDVFDDLPVMSKIENVPCQLYRNKDDRYYTLKIDLKAVA